MAARLSGQTSIFGVVFFVSKFLLGIKRQGQLKKYTIFPESLEERGLLGLADKNMTPSMRMRIRRRKRRIRMWWGSSSRKIIIKRKMRRRKRKKTREVKE